jgi:exopolyphosphatase/guanosine-5'-triphosphate,3'-diphosphate pyrophosphatase
MEISNTSKSESIVERSLKFAAIDIGSNAVRLLLSRVFEDGSRTYYKKESLIRMPNRLGDDAFTKNHISDLKARKLIKTMQGFKLLLESYQPIDYMACATSAMREANNGLIIAEKIQNQSGIDLRIVDGKKEAEIIFANHIETILASSDSYLYIDVGGGSCELTIISQNKKNISASFKIGAVRLLEGLVEKSEWKQMKKWIKNLSQSNIPVSAIGSGGNINKIFRLSDQKEGKPVNLKKLSKIYQQLQSYTYEDHIKILNLRPDRADVIIPACQIYLNVMKWARISKIFVPEVGLADGLIHILYEKYKGNTN